jgi:hypothetical protein
VPAEAADEETAEIAALQHLAWEDESVEEVEEVCNGGKEMTAK